MITACDAALGLRALAGIVDDERIDVRHRAQHRLWQAGFRQGQRLAGQPFEVAVLAHVDDGMRAPVVAQPDVEGEIVVRRDEIGGVVGVGRVDVVAAGRLQADDGIAETVDRQLEAAVWRIEACVFAPRRRGRPAVPPSGLRCAGGLRRAGSCSVPSRWQAAGFRRPTDPRGRSASWWGRPSGAPSGRRCLREHLRYRSPEFCSKFRQLTVAAGVSRPTPLARRPSLLG